MVQRLSKLKYGKAVDYRNLIQIVRLNLVRLAGFEPAAYGLEVRCSIQLSYRRTQPDFIS